jgi:superfamily I DNA/RNA helicase
MDLLVRRYAARLGERLAAWVDVGSDLRAKWESTPGSGFERLAAFWPRLSPAQREDVEGLRRRIEGRIRDHRRDLSALFADLDLCREVLPKALHRALPAARRRAEQLADRGQQDWEDAALLLRLAQVKARLYPRVSCPFLDRYHHVLVDEAQDLSLVEIAALVEASDPCRSVTVAGDPAQAIYQEVSADEFDAFLGGLAGVPARVDVLSVGHRSTRPIMALAERALGRSGESARGRDGTPVRWLRGEEATAAAVSREVAAWRAPRERALVAVVARTRREADRWAKDLEAAGLAEVRRAERDSFRFEPGVVVTNAHQVKGLEFDGVVALDPAAYPERDRKLLHVVLTRAVEQLWVVAPRGDGVLGPS